MGGEDDALRVAVGTTGDGEADDKARAAARLLSRWRFFFKVLFDPVGRCSCADSGATYPVSCPETMYPDSRSAWNGTGTQTPVASLEMTALRMSSKSLSMADGKSSGSPGKLRCMLEQYSSRSASVPVLGLKGIDVCGAVGTIRDDVMVFENGCCDKTGI